MVAANTVVHGGRGELAAQVLRGLSTIEACDLTGGNMTLELVVTLWMTKAGCDVATLRQTLLELREVLLESSVLDEATEPVPLVAADERTAVLSLATYLWGLLRRAAASVSSPPATLAEEALATLVA